MFVSRKKLKALADELVSLKKENSRLEKDNKRLSDSNLDLWYDCQLMKIEKLKKEGKKTGEYFYGDK